MQVILALKIECVVKGNRENTKKLHILCSQKVLIKMRVTCTGKFLIKHAILTTT